MRRSLGLLVSATAVMWVWLLLDMGSSTRALDLGPSSASTTQAIDSPSNSAPRSKPSWPVHIVTRATQMFSPPPPPTATMRLALSTLDTQPAGELGPAGRSPEFKALHERYARETRDGAWAMQQERRVSALFTNHELAPHVVLLNCQTTVCQLVLEGDAPDLVTQLWYVPNIQRETGLRPQSPYSLRSGQLSLYFETAERPSDGQSSASKTSP
jgi:hypothetical protein